MGWIKDIHEVSKDLGHKFILIGLIVIIGFLFIFYSLIWPNIAKNQDLSNLNSDLKMLACLVCKNDVSKDTFCFKNGCAHLAQFELQGKNYNAVLTSSVPLRKAELRPIQSSVQSKVELKNADFEPSIIGITTSPLTGNLELRDVFLSNGKEISPAEKAEIKSKLLELRDIHFNLIENQDTLNLPERTK